MKKEIKNTAKLIGVASVFILASKVQATTLSVTCPSANMTVALHASPSVPGSYSAFSPMSLNDGSAESVANISGTSKLPIAAIMLPAGCQITGGCSATDWIANGSIYVQFNVGSQPYHISGNNVNGLKTGAKGDFTFHFPKKNATSAVSCNVSIQ